MEFADSPGVIGIAVVGYGYWGPNLVRNFGELEDVRVVLCCDQDPSRLRRLRTRYPGIATTTDFAEVLRHPEVDAVALATPIGTHYALARRALEHGKHVLVEKPLAARWPSAEHLVEMAAQRGLTLMVDHTFIYTGAVRAMKRVVDAGELGDLYYFDSVRINLGLVQRDVNVLWDLAPHDIAILDHLVGGGRRCASAPTAPPPRTGPENVAYLSVVLRQRAHRPLPQQLAGPGEDPHRDPRRQPADGRLRRPGASEKVKVYDRGVEMTGPEDQHRAPASPTASATCRAPARRDRGPAHAVGRVHGRHRGRHGAAHRRRQRPERRADPGGRGDVDQAPRDAR